MSLGVWHESRAEEKKLKGIMVDRYLDMYL